MKKTLSILAIAGLVLALAPSAQAAAVLFVDSDSAVTASNSAPNDFTLTAEGAGTRDGIYSYNYNAGASFDMLVVSVSREASGETFSVSYDGVDMGLATGTANGSGASIFYLATSAQSGTIALDYTAVGTVNGIGIGIAAIKSDNGDPIGLIDANVGTGTSITIDPTSDDSFTMFAVDANYNCTISGFGTAPLTQIYSSNDIGSSAAGASYDTDVDAGEITYSYTFTNVSSGSARSIAAANFAVIPEPATMSLLAIGGIALIRRRRK